MVIFFQVSKHHAILYGTVILNTTQAEHCVLCCYIVLKTNLIVDKSYDTTIQPIGHHDVIVMTMCNSYLF